MSGISGIEQLAILFNKCLDEAGYLQVPSEQNDALWKAFGKFAEMLVEMINETFEEG